MIQEQAGDKKTTRAGPARTKQLRGRNAHKPVNGFLYHQAASNHDLSVINCV